MDLNIQKDGRALLKRNWNKLDMTKTDQGLGIQMPPIEAPYDEKNGKFIELVPFDKLKTGSKPLVSLIESRKSRRKLKEPLSLNDLSYMLWATQGVREFNKEKNAAMRTVPSAGNRHAFETYIYVNNVTDLETGLYRYLPLSHRLLLIDNTPGLEERASLASRKQIFGGVTFMWTTVAYRMEYRYDQFSYKNIALDAGHVCQNLYLACEDIDCGCCAIAAYDQDFADSFLKVDGNDEFTVYMASVGRYQ